MLNICSIINSLDGECNAFRGAGQLSTFVRLQGCNLRCKWCDTPYARGPMCDRSRVLSVPEILKKLRFNKVTITGGEPFLQHVEELIFALLAKEREITIETNGSFVVPSFGPSVRYVIDYKLPSSGMSDKMNGSVFDDASCYDIIKFVIAGNEDYEEAKKVLGQHPQWKAQIYFSPAVNGIYGRTVLADMLVNDGDEKIALNLQLHKILWPGRTDK